MELSSAQNRPSLKQVITLPNLACIFFLYIYDLIFFKQITRKKIGWLAVEISIQSYFMVSLAYLVVVSPNIILMTGKVFQHYLRA
ncbi:hypothetical protein EON73_00945 [bacterium]|nr:MAG: hypothetical protein EON73_00945 [bacterium]